MPVQEDSTVKTWNASTEMLLMAANAPAADWDTLLSDTGWSEVGTSNTRETGEITIHLKEIGGHNPFEPAQAGAAVITEPGYFNFAETFAPLIESGGTIEVRTAQDLATAVATWLSDKVALAGAQSAVKSCVNTQKSALDDVTDTLCTHLSLT